MTRAFAAPAPAALCLQLGGGEGRPRAALAPSLRRTLRARARPPALTVHPSIPTL